MLNLLCKRVYTATYAILSDFKATFWILLIILIITRTLRGKGVVVLCFGTSQVGLLRGSLTGCLAQLVGWLVGFLIDLLIRWLSYWLVGWLVGWSVDQFVG